MIDIEPVAGAACGKVLRLVEIGGFDSLNYLQPRIFPARPSTQLLLSGMSYVVIYIESRPFTKRLQQLTGASAAGVLNKIQADLMKNPTRGDSNIKLWSFF